MAEQFDRVFALLKFDRDDLIGWLAEYFGFRDEEGTYFYNLVRSKTAFSRGTVDIADFEEVNDGMTADLADFLLTKLRTTDERA